jgi:hypothetical protein
MGIPIASSSPTSSPPWKEGEAPRQSRLILGSAFCSNNSLIAEREAPLSKPRLPAARALPGTNRASSASRNRRVVAFQNEFAQLRYDHSTQCRQPPGRSTLDAETGSAYRSWPFRAFQTAYASAASKGGRLRPRPSWYLQRELAGTNFFSCNSTKLHRAPPRRRLCLEGLLLAPIHDNCPRAGAENRFY